MEATAKGASERNGSSIGVIVPTVLVNREKNGNRYLTDRVICDTLNHRIETLIDLGDAYIILPGMSSHPLDYWSLGSLGTLNEFIELMTVYYIKNPKNMKPVFAFENPWKRIWTTICSDLSVYSLHPSIMLGG